jgi:hypothetical protein
VGKSQQNRDEIFFRQDNREIRNGHWAGLPLRAKAVYLPIASYCDTKGVAFPGEVTIAILSGLTEKVVRMAARDLQQKKFTGFTISYRRTRHGKAKSYYITPPPPKLRDATFWPKGIFVRGVWRVLSPSAKALLPVFRCFAQWDHDLYSSEEEDEGDLCDPRLSNQFYRSRKWDVYHESAMPGPEDKGTNLPARKALAQYAGIALQPLYDAFAELEAAGWVEKFGTNDEGKRRWKVYTLPPGLREDQF